MLIREKLARNVELVSAMAQGPARIGQRKARFRADLDLLLAQQPTSFDHFSCLYEKRVWHCNAKRFCGLEIDDQIEPGWLQDRQAGRFFARQNAAGASENVVTSSEVRDLAN
jgi:hypothetical protein